MKTINIPSVSGEHCLVTLRFHESEDGQINAVDLDCQTPTFKASIQVCIDEKESLISFINDLKIIEKERKGECQFFDEWVFSLTIRSIDSVGHFAVNVWIQDLRESRGSVQPDTLEFAYEIEPSLLISLVEDFSSLKPQV